jgi:hypothetical protein
MKLHTPIIALLLLAGSLQASTITLSWENPNPPGFVTKYTLYKKVWTSVSSATWQKVKDLPASALTTTVEYVEGQVNVFSLTSWQGVIESSARAELAVQPPLIPTNLKQLP